MGELASEASLRGRLQLQIWEMYRDCYQAPSQSRLSAVPALSKGEPRGGRCPPSVGGKLAGTRRRSHPYELKNFEPSANYAPGTMRYVCVGADTIRPVVSPEGKQRRRKAPTMHHRTFYDEIRRYHESNMVYWQHCCIGWCVTVLLKNLQRWRADDIRPYTVCATE